MEEGRRAAGCRGLARPVELVGLMQSPALQGQQQDQPAPPPQDDQQPGQSPVQSPGKRPAGRVGPMQSLLLQANGSTGKAIAEG